MHKRVLVIDDEQAVRKSFELALKKTPYTLDAAAKGEEGLKLLQEQAYDLIYLDLKMPGMSGVETLLRIREKDKDIPVYIVTAFHKEFFDELTEARKQEIEFELLMKPIGLEQIREITSAILDDEGHFSGGEHDV